ncbi:MAG: hypothetical protein EOO88_41545 [Pedobacter sp.]|nr:MAG: hypothetical protein EOO88_41545 [Pedobacter sp.]
MLQPGEIVYARITCATIPAKPKAKPKVLTAPPFVFAASWGGYNTNLSWNNREDRMSINKFGVQEDLVLIKLEVISRHGFIGKHLKSQQNTIS